MTGQDWSSGVRTGVLTGQDWSSGLSGLEL